MTDNVTPLRPQTRARPAEPQLACPGVFRDQAYEQSLYFVFSRRVTDDEMRYLHDVMQRAVAMVRGTPPAPAPTTDPIA